MPAQRKAGANSRPPADEQLGAGEPDVLLDVPKLTVDEIALEVDNLHARIALEARLADLVQLHVGVDARIEGVALEIKGVEAQAQLRARLDKVLAIVERALQTVDKNPELLTDLSRSVQDAAGAVGNGAGQLGEAAGELTEGVGDSGSDATEVVDTDSGSSPRKSRSKA